MTKVCSLFGGETTGSQDIPDIKAEKKEDQAQKETSRQKCNFSPNCSLPETIKAEWKQDWNIMLRWRPKGSEKSEDEVMQVHN